MIQERPLQTLYIAFVAFSAGESVHTNWSPNSVYAEQNFLVNSLYVVSTLHDR